MCGIAGILKVHDPAAGEPPHPLAAIPEAWLDTLDDAIAHRGPDGQGRFRDRTVRADGVVVDVAFVHRRLSIIDHAGGHQPMVHDGERLRADLTYARGETPRLAHELCPAGERPGLVAVVFNGCIYNHRELRAELEGLGHRFETDHSDTEVLVHGWRAWQTDLANELDGMHAALVWDRARGQIGFGRDVVGEKPLIKGWIQERLPNAAICWCSCAPGLAAFTRPDLPPEVALPSRTIADYVRFGFDDWPPFHTDRVLQEWSATARIPSPNPSSSAAAPRRVSRVHLARRGEEPIKQFQLPIENVLPYLERAVASRLEADVPLGVFLSGGLDSALIAAIARQHRPDIKAFTVRMPEAAFDESEAAAETARSIGVDHTVLDCEPEPAADLVRLIEQLGLPFGDSSLLPTYWVSKAARGHVKVALSGDGGDELFGGYRRHEITPTLNRWHGLLRLIPDGVLDQRTPGTRSTYLARLAQAARHGGYPELLAIFSTPDLRRLVPTIDGETPDDDEFERIDDPLRHDFEHYLPDDLLRKTDTASMAVALEVRAPFLARDLVEAALRTPISVLMPRGERKGLLKRVARKYLPDYVVDRPKRGFAIPVGEWFRTDFGGMRTLLYDHLESTDPFPGLGEAGVEIDMGFVRRMLREHDAAGEKSVNPWHGRDHSQRLYMLLVLSIWAKWLARVRSG